MKHCTSVFSSSFSFRHPSSARKALSFAFAGAAVSLGLLATQEITACVPPGNAPPFDAGVTESVSLAVQDPNVLKTVFIDTFDRPNAELPANSPPASLPSVPSLAPSSILPDAGTPTRNLPQVSLKSPSPLSSLGLGKLQPASSAPGALASSISSSMPDPLSTGWSKAGPDWYSLSPTWHIENGKLCGQTAQNKGIWLRKPIPINARIEFDAVTESADGDLKAEVWGDGKTGAKTTSYTNASSYLVIYGGWKNSIHAIARLNEHGSDRKEIKVVKDSDDPKQKPVWVAQTYRFRIERNDSKTVKWYLDDELYLSFEDPNPLVGIGHDHMGFNDWSAKVCFDNLKITPL